MTKIRHISYRAEDVDAMAKFFIDALGLTMVQKRKDNSIDLSDGSINISILPLAANRSVGAGLDHIGFSAEDNREQIRRVEAVGALKERTRSPYEESLRSRRDHRRRRPLARRGAGGQRVMGNDFSDR
jgi:hypothetical protein